MRTVVEVRYNENFKYGDRRPLIRVNYRQMIVMRPYGEESYMIFVLSYCSRNNVY